MVSELIRRLRRVKIRQSVEEIVPGQYLTCPHWWSWWLPNSNPVWHFHDDEGAIHACYVTYGVEPAVITTSGAIVGGIWFGAPDTFVVYGQELDTRTAEANKPTLFILAEHRAEVEALSFPSGTVSAILVVPQSAKWSAELSSSMHEKMIEAMSDVMRRAFVDILDATWVPLYNANLVSSGSGLPGEANSLIMTLRWRSFR
jgi:hypothetical protein